MRNRDSSKKKLGVLVSSLALVAVTAMAGVTGTAAWFTANRTNSATASTFTAKAPSGDLNITADGITDKGTAVEKSETDATKNKKVLVKENATNDTLDNYLGDASFDATTGKLWRANMKDGDNDPIGFSEVNTYYSGAKVDDHKIYYAVSWTFTFSYTNPNTKGSALFFDPTNSKFDGPSADISKGFRIVMNNYTASGSATVNDNDYLVWANGTVNSHVSGSASDATATYPETNFVSVGQGSYDRWYNGIDEGTAKEKRDYIGTFKASTDTITVTCTAWYEGTDQVNVITRKVSADEALTATMGFYVVDLA